MAVVECRDVFNAVYTYVKGSYISSLYSKKTKLKIYNNVDTEDYEYEKSEVGETKIETGRHSSQALKDVNENVEEAVAREAEEDVADKIRMDIEEKFPFALASVCSNLACIDREYRKIKRFEEQPEFSEYLIEKADDFPLSERFVFPAIMYVSSMVLMDIDDKRSDDLYEKYASSVSNILSEIHFEQGSTVEKYPY